MKNIMNELIENRLAELNASRIAIENDLERQAEAEKAEAEKGLAKIENWKADPHKAMFGRYSSEWD